MKRGRITVAIFTMATLVFGEPACTPTASPTPQTTPITVQLQWTHQAQFAGLYAADQQDYYRDEGLEVSFIEGGTNVDNLESVLNEQALYGVASAEQVIVARAEGKQLTAIAAIYRRNPTVFISLADSGITRPQDFAGKIIRMPRPIIPTLHAMCSRVGISPDQYSEVFLPTDVSMFASGDPPIWGGYSNGILSAIQQAGYPVNIIYPDDYGVHFYGDILFASEDTLNRLPDVTLRFLRASLNGWSYAIENPLIASRLVLKYKPDADPALEDLKMSANIPLVQTGMDNIGWMRVEEWTGMEQTLREQGVLTTSLEIDQAYTLEFLEKIYP